jgi:hypothetical protein
LIPWDVEEIRVTAYVTRRIVSIIKDKGSDTAENPDDPQNNKSGAQPIDLVRHLEALKNGLEVSAKVAVGLVVTLYVFGLIVVNVYLSRYGVYSLSLFRLNYITAGLWGVMFLVLGSLLSVAATVALFKKSGFRTGRRVFDLGSTLAVVGAHVYLALMAGAVIALFATGQASLVGGFCLCLVSGYTLFEWFPMVIETAIEKDEPFAGRLITVIFILFITVIFVGFHLWSVGSFVYGQIPGYWGGGAPTEAKLLFKKEADASAKLSAIGVKIDNAGFSENTDVLLALDGEYVILIKHGESRGLVITLPKVEIQMVLYGAPRPANVPTSTPEEVHEPLPPPQAPTPEESNSPTR